MDAIGPITGLAALFKSPCPVNYFTPQTPQLVARHLPSRPHHAVVDNGGAARVMSGRRGAVHVLGAGPQSLHGGAQDSARGGAERARRLGMAGRIEQLKTNEAFHM